jgi:hypothetical protein
MKPAQMLATLILAVSIVAAPAAWSEEAAPAAEGTAPETEQIIRGMCDHLKSLKAFSYWAEVSYDAPDENGEKVLYAFEMETSVRRPDRLRVNASGDAVDKQFFFDGKTVTLVDLNKKMYADADVPPDIESALDAAHKQFDLRVALADLASPDLCRHLSDGWGETRDLGLSRVWGVDSHHLVLDREDTRLQLWIDAGKNPLPLKVVISDKKQPGAPEWTAVLTHWNVSAKLNDSLFAFAAPKGVERIEFLPAGRPGPGAGGKK